MLVKGAFVLPDDLKTVSPEMNIPMQLTPGRAFPAVWHRTRPRMLTPRSFRILLLLAALWVMNLFDLFCTLMAYRIGHFGELNPLAESFIHHPPSVLSFKLAALIFSTGTFWLTRKMRVAEISCWGLTVVYSYLSAVWIQYFVYFSEIR